MWAGVGTAQLSPGGGLVGQGGWEPLCQLGFGTGALQEQRREPRDHPGRRVSETSGVKSRGSSGLSQCHMGPGNLHLHLLQEPVGTLAPPPGAPGKLLGCHCLND